MKRSRKQGDKTRRRPKKSVKRGREGGQGDEARKQKEQKGNN